ncbi:MAG: hypothetical protein L6R35_003027 [Caloplaca aegaea]|nr:MAG: hypothetical protein L6R35_003027 [Caloplaca aegaea]
MDKLPPELVLQIAHHLDAFDIVKFHFVSRRLHKITRDKELWKRLCFDDSDSTVSQKRRDLQFIAPNVIRDSARVFELHRRARALSATSGLGTGNGPHSSNPRPESSRAIADWDPSYSNEEIDWYGEYVSRHAPISMSWLQQPDMDRENRESKGLGKYDRDDKSLVIAPLDDGSLCVWNLGQQNEAERAAGAVVCRSKKNLFSTYVSPIRQTIPSLVECISVDKVRNKAHVAVDDILAEVDLETLQVSSSEQYPFAISALSDSTYPVPLTVATTYSLHLHDFRELKNSRFAGSDHSGRIDCNSAGAQPSSGNRNNLRRLSAGGDCGTKTTLSVPAPLSITHVPSTTGQHDPLGGHICIAGRFPSILTYDRRMFPQLSSTIHNGSRLASLTSIPHPLLYSRSYPPSYPDAAHTLIACGEYNGKGSLELYPFSTSTEPNLPVPSPASTTPYVPTSALVTPYKNRTSASRSKLLSVTPHGTRLVYSDGDGGLKWVERDGHTLVRRWNINAYNASTGPGPGPGPNPPSLLSQMFANASSSSAQDGGNVVRKILPLGPWEDAKGELALWTGEKIGVLGFRPKPRFEWEWDREEKEDKEEKEFRVRMRRALERQADDVRFVRGLGLAG